MCGAGARVSVIDRCVFGPARKPLAKQRRRTIIPDRKHLPRPPVDLLQGGSLFLDLDGTLLELVDDPGTVRADARLRGMLVALAARLDGRLAVISGRSLAQVDAILGEAAAGLALSGSHGCEHRWNGVLAQPERPAALDEATAQMRAFASARDGVLVEEKSFGVALHYRQAPELEQQATALTSALAEGLGLTCQPGKMVAELRVAGGDKGRAVRQLMARHPMRGTRPVFVGDDLTDEPGFAAARELGGHGILIGPARATAANYGFPTPAELRAWLAKVAR
jgi:trehalose 6-phosphate phosphatase